MKVGEKRIKLTMASALFLAMSASLCCIVPFVAALLGIAGVGVSEFIAPWRPYLLAITFSLLGVGFYLAYRPQPGQACERGGECSQKGVRRWNRRSVWFAAVLVIAFSVFPHYGGHLLRAISGGSQPAVTVNENDNAHLVLKIEGMDCPVCAEALQKRLRQIPGVSRADVSFRTKQAALEYDPRTADQRDFVNAITDEGFKVIESTRDKN